MKGLFLWPAVGAFCSAALFQIGAHRLWGAPYAALAGVWFVSGYLCCMVNTWMHLPRASGSAWWEREPGSSWVRGSGPPPARLPGDTGIPPTP
jgi:hypothetical protein